MNSLNVYNFLDSRYKATINSDKPWVQKLAEINIYHRQATNQLEILTQNISKKLNNQNYDIVISNFSVLCSSLNLAKNTIQASQSKYPNNIDNIKNLNKPL